MNIPLMIHKSPSMLSSIPPLQDDEEDIYDVESLFTNILIQEIMNYTIEQV